MTIPKTVPSRAASTRCVNVFRAPAILSSFMYLPDPDYPALRASDDPAKAELMHWFEGRRVIESWVPIVAHNWVILFAKEHTALAVLFNKK